MRNVQSGHLLVDLPLPLPSCQTSSCCPSNHTAAQRRFKNPSALTERIQQCRLVTLCPDCAAPHQQLVHFDCKLHGPQLPLNNLEVLRGFHSGFPISELSFSLLLTLYFIYSVLNTLSPDLPPFLECYFRILSNMPGQGRGWAGRKSGIAPSSQHPRLWSLPAHINLPPACQRANCLSTRKHHNKDVRKTLLNILGNRVPLRS